MSSGLIISAEDIKELPHYKYCETIKTIQDLQRGGAFYLSSLEDERVRWHKEILKHHRYDSENKDTYFRSKYVFDNLDRICNIFSECKESELIDDRDVLFCANYLYQFCMNCKFSFFMDGNISEESLWY